MKEFGGFLPLELNLNEEYYGYSDTDMVRLNSGRAAIIYAIKDGGFNKVYLPLYLCNSVAVALGNAEINYEFYNIDINFLPTGINLKENEVLLWPNYYGVQLQSKVDELVARYKNLIIDNTQAFFSKPILSAYNIYSCRKFFGVSDGSYLIHHNLKKRNFANTMSFERSLFLLKSIECGTNEAYSDNLINEMAIEKEPHGGMSLLTKSILRSIDYKDVINKRNQNFGMLDSILRQCNLIQFNEYAQAPMVYPLLVKKSIRDKLIEKNIYVSQWWKRVLDSELSNDFEKELSEYLIPLPIDQRYSKSDMEELGQIVMRVLEKDYS